MNIQEEDKIKIKLYKEFYQNNKDLFNTDCQQYMHEQRQYVERKIIEVKYNLRNIKNDMG